MNQKTYEIESFKPFSESLIWQLNREYYHQAGINAWSDNVVPHHMTSNSMVGLTYAKLIFAFLEDLARKGKTEETVYILELGSGHGRLAFHILKHLQRKVLLENMELPPFCYILSDIVEDNLSFFLDHPDFEKFFNSGHLDVSYFHATESKEIYLRHKQAWIKPKGAHQPLIAIANYFFDSIPNDLLHIHDSIISNCSISLHTSNDPGMKSEALLETIELTYRKDPIRFPFYTNKIWDEILVEYKQLVVNTHLFYPKNGFKCLDNLKNLSTDGLALLSMDKGFHDIHDLDNKDEPELIAHGSFSLWVNYHAIGAYCKKQGGLVLLPASSNFHLDLCTMLFVSESETYTRTKSAFEDCVENFGPDDFNSIKHITYTNLPTMDIVGILACLRLSAYDSTFFIKMLPRIKQLVHEITFNERRRLAQALHQVWNLYFNINEPLDLSYELGAIFYDLGMYKDALTYFQLSHTQLGDNADVYYNMVLCYYQLRQDKLFAHTLDEAKLAFPDNENFMKLDELDMTAV